MRNKGLASDDLDITNERTTEVHHISCGRDQRTRFKPEHLVYPMVLSINVRPAQSHREERKTGLTFRRDTSVTRPNGPAIELSSTSVFAPLTFERKHSESASPSVFARPRDPAKAHRVQRVDQGLSPYLLKHGNVWTRFFILFQPGEVRDPLFVLGRVRCRGGSHVTWRRSPISRPIARTITPMKYSMSKLFSSNSLRGDSDSYVPMSPNIRYSPDRWPSSYN